MNLSEGDGVLQGDDTWGTVPQVLCFNGVNIHWPPVVIRSPFWSPHYWGRSWPNGPWLLILTSPRDSLCGLSGVICMQSESLTPQVKVTTSSYGGWVLSPRWNVNFQRLQ